MTTAADILAAGNYSLVILTPEGKKYAFRGRGVSDLYSVYSKSPEILAGSDIADKVIGYGAALLMVAGNVRSVYSPVISRDAAMLFEKNNVCYTAGSIVNHIINRNGTGRCPLESRLIPMKNRSIVEQLIEIDSFVTNLWLNKS